MIDKDLVKKEPGPLLEGFEWVTMDLTNEGEVSVLVIHASIFASCTVAKSIFAKLTEVHDLLMGHYVEDDEAMFRFNYSQSFLDWYDTLPLKI